MLAQVSTEISCTEEELWRKITQPSSLQDVSAPLLKFVPVGEGVFDEEWQVGGSYELKLYLFGFIPLGKHRIHITKLDGESHTIVSDESGSLVRSWRHTISFHQTGRGKVNYTDEIKIEAGPLTPAIWGFANVFYRHRQRRWKEIIN